MAILIECVQAVAQEHWCVDLWLGRKDFPYHLHLDFITNIPAGSHNSAPSLTLATRLEAGIVKQQHKFQWNSVC